MSFYNYSKNKADCEAIETHLRQCSELFNPPLDDYVNIYEYAKKIRSNAVTIEAWMNDDLIGMVACYLNNYETLDGYVTNISTMQEHQGKGVASILLNKAIEAALIENFKTLSLEVEVDNKKAINLYRKAGFVLNGRKGNKYLMINRLFERKDVLVSICCVTYNHVKYIRDAIEGFLTQKVDFPFEILIHDDASIDGTTDIIREYEKNYPEIIKPIYQTENQYSQGRKIFFVYQFPRARGKYIAMCEGDDYWIDPYKLQKQVNFLETQPEFGLVHTDYLRYIQRTKSLTERKNKITNSGYIFKQLLKQNFIGTLTVCFRRSVYLEYLNNENSQKFAVGDWPLWIELSRVCKIHYLDEITSVYRYVNNSATHRNITYQFKLLRSLKKIQNYYLNLYSNELTFVYKLSCLFNFINIMLKVILTFILQKISILEKKW